MSRALHCYNLILLSIPLIQQYTLSKKGKIFTFRVLKNFVQPSCMRMQLDSMVVYIHESSMSMYNISLTESFVVISEHADEGGSVKVGRLRSEIDTFSSLYLRELKQVGWKFHNLCTLCCSLLHWIDRLRWNFYGCVLMSSKGLLSGVARTPCQKSLVLRQTWCCWIIISNKHTLIPSMRKGLLYSPLLIVIVMWNEL